MIERRLKKAEDEYRERIKYDHVVVNEDLDATVREVRRLAGLATQEVEPMNVLLAAGASVAIYKACDLASKLVQDGHAVKTVLTRRGGQARQPPALRGAHRRARPRRRVLRRARRAPWTTSSSRDWGELLLVAPASADLLARLALGLGGDLVGTVALAWQHPRPRLLCPAMNPNMLAAAPIARHLETLRGDGWQVIEPEDGHMACGVSGKGRLPDPEAIRRAVQEIAKGFRRAGP